MKNKKKQNKQEKQKLRENQPEMKIHPSFENKNEKQKIPELFLKKNIKKS